MLRPENRQDSAMLVKRLLIVAAVVGTLAFSSRAFAQDESRETTTTVAAAADSQDGPQKANDTPPKPKSFVERLNNFGKTIFGGGPAASGENLRMPQRHLIRLRRARNRGQPRRGPLSSRVDDTRA